MYRILGFFEIPSIAVSGIETARTFMKGKKLSKVLLTVFIPPLILSRVI